MKIGYFGQGEDARMVEIEPDAEGSHLAALQGLVGGLIEVLDVLWTDGATLVVNEEGIYDDACHPSAVVYANAHMAEAGYLSQLGGTVPVSEGDFYTVLFGPVLVVAEDPETGELRDLTAAEFERAAGELGASGIRQFNAEFAVDAILQGREPLPRPAIVSRAEAAPSEPVPAPAARRGDRAR